MSKYTPRPGSKLAKLVNFLKENPNEFLTYEDIFNKFGFKTIRSVESNVSELVRKGVLDKIIVVHINQEYNHGK